MIVADKKPIEEIIDYVKDHQSILVLGCNECVTVCEVGGKKEVGLLASALRMHFLQQGREVNVGERTLERQCDHEYLEEMEKEMNEDKPKKSNLKMAMAKDEDYEDEED